MGPSIFFFYETAGRNWPNARILRDGTQTFFDSSEAFHSPSFSILNNQLEVLGDITKNYPVWLNDQAHPSRFFKLYRR